ncbi:MAG: class I SAM-dependent methyltransferase [Bacillota bacterium]
MNKRREEILSVIPKCEVLCDVGCDHGYVGFECLLRGIAGKVIFSDISAPSLEKAKSLLQGDGELLKRASFCVANGLDGVSGIDVDACVIAGMGGEEIMKILSGETPKFCVLQPMSEVEKLREFLAGRFEILSDRLFYDRGKYYNLLLCENSGASEKLSKFEVMFGKTNLQKPEADFLEFATARLKRQKAIKKARSTTAKEDDEIIDFLEEFLKNHS